MSTVDPRIAREQKQAAASSWTRPIDAALVALHAALWGIAGFGFVFMNDTMRLMSIDQVGDTWSSRYEASGLEFIPLAGILLGAPLGFLVTARFARWGLAAASILPLVSGLLGAAFGMLISLPAWTPPQAVGEKLGFFEGDPREPWGFGEWVSYSLPYWLPALLGLAGILAAVGVVAAVRSNRNKQAIIAGLLEGGTRVRGVVTEVIATGVKVQGLPRMQFTVTFTDTAGVQRWVTKKGHFAPASVPRAGDAAVVWFNPLNPGVEKEIAVGLGAEAEELAGA